MFNIGDKVKCIKSFITYSSKDMAPKAGEILTIEYIEGAYLAFRELRQTDGTIWVNWGASCFEYFQEKEKKLPPKTEVEWLDRVQNNFKESQ